MVVLIQFVDLTVQESDGIRGHTQVDEEGRHYLELIKDNHCDVCTDDETELVEDENGVSIEESTAYRIKGVIQTSPLCREHLAQQPTHVGFTEPNGGET